MLWGNHCDKLGLGGYESINVCLCVTIHLFVLQCFWQCVFTLLTRTETSHRYVTFSSYKKIMLRNSFLGSSVFILKKKFYCKITTTTMFLLSMMKCYDFEWSFVFGIYLFLLSIYLFIYLDIEYRLHYS